MPVFDQGYQHWSGKLSGHTWRWLTISRRGVRVGMTNPVLRILVIVSWLPAAGLAFMLCAWGLVEQKSPLIAPLLDFLTAIFGPELMANPKHYRVVVWTLCFDQFLSFELYVSMVVVLLVGPGLISQDLRFNALPLYFSRPLRRIDYFAGKLGTIAWFLSLVLIVPSLLAYLLGMLFSLDVTILWDTFPLLLACLAYGAVIVLSTGTLVLGLSALSRNSRYIALFWIVLWSVGGIVGTILNAVDSEQRLNKHYRNQAMLYEDEMRAGPVVVGDQMPLDKQFEQQQAEQRARQAARTEKLKQAEAELLDEEARAAETNWRWLVSYTANLSRVGDQLLGVNAAWTTLARLQPPDQRELFLRRHLAPRYPWYWSAAVLTALFGISAWILNRRVRSLDRLK
jgi:ABC-2 type transport system permease protein